MQCWLTDGYMKRWGVRAASVSAVTNFEAWQTDWITTYPPMFYIPCYVLGVFHFQSLTYQWNTNFCFTGSALSRVSERDGLEGSFGIFGLQGGLERMPNVPYSRRDGERWELFFLLSLSTINPSLSYLVPSLRILSLVCLFISYLYLICSLIYPGSSLLWGLCPFFVILMTASVRLCPFFGGLIPLPENEVPFL